MTQPRPPRSRDSQSPLAQPARTVAGQFRQRFGRDPEWLVAAPGRVNLIGDHTDYNDGFVFPMAIERYTLLAAAPRETRTEHTINAYSVNLDAHDEFEIARDSLESSGQWTDYIKGVLAEFLDRGLAPHSLDIVVSSDVPMGCGLSSSAALQVATAKLLQQLAGDVVSDADIPALCQAAEHRFAGVPVGIMDQFCIANARAGDAIFLDCHTNAAEQVPLDVPGAAVLIIDSHVSRQLRSGAYAERRAQCDEACRIMGISSLRDATKEIVEAARQALGDTGYRRARHVTSEDERTLAAVKAIRANEPSRFGELMYESHHSLQQDYEVSCSEIDTLVDQCATIGRAGGIYGARMTGGGFGGCVVALIEGKKAPAIIEELTARYRDATGNDLSAYVSSPAAGARIVERNEWESL